MEGKTDSHTRPRVLRILTRLNVGGPALHVANLAEGLKNQYDHLLVVGEVLPTEGSMDHLFADSSIHWVKISDFKVSFKLWDDMSAFWKLFKIIREFKPHIVHTHTTKAGAYGRLAAWMNRVPVVVHSVHGHMLGGYGGIRRLYPYVERLLGIGTDALCAVSDSVKRDLVQQSVFRKDKVHVIPLGLKLDSFVQARSDRQGQLRQKYRLLSEKLVGIVGRLAPVKNHLLFLEAVTLVQRECPDAHFMIFGDGELRQSLEKRVRELGIENNVTLCGWERDTESIYADLDVLVCSSLNEGTSVSVIEALAAGVPVVSTNVGGMSDVLSKGEYGKLVPSEDASELAKAVIQVIGSSDNRSDNIKYRIVEKYSVSRLCSDMDGLYRKLLAGIVDH